MKSPDLTEELLEKACHVAEILDPCAPHDRLLVLREALFLQDSQSESGSNESPSFNEMDTLLSDAFLEATVDWFDQLLRELPSPARSDLLRLLSLFQSSFRAESQRTAPHTVSALVRAS